jgi:hypothetical protein
MLTIQHAGQTEFRDQNSGQKFKRSEIIKYIYYIKLEREINLKEKQVFASPRLFEKRYFSREIEERWAWR